MASLTSLLTPASDGSSGVVTKQPKVFFNGTLTAADLTGNDTWTLFTNDATTTSVIEAVLIDGSVTFSNADGESASGTFINDTIALGKTENLAGSEITAPSTSLTIKLDTPLVAGGATHYPEGNQTLVIDSSNSAKFYTYSDVAFTTKSNYPLVSIEEDELIAKYFDPTFDGTRTTSFGSITVPSMSNSSWYYSTGNHAYYFYTDGNAQTRLYHATITGGTFGAWSYAVNQTYSYMALDLSVNKAFYSKSGDVFEWDLATNNGNVLGNSVSGFRGSSTYTTAGAANGVFFHVPNSSYTSNFSYYDTNDDTYGSLNLPASFGSSNNSFLGACYNPDENKFYLSIGYSGNAWTYSVDWSTKTVLFLGYASQVYPNNIATTKAILGNNKGEMFIHSAANEFEIIKFENDVATVQETITDINGITNPYSNSAWYRKLTEVTQTAALDASDHIINLKCKVSGTEYKEG
jgi:hypothetical protein